MAVRGGAGQWTELRRTHRSEGRAWRRAAIQPVSRWLAGQAVETATGTAPEAAGSASAATDSSLAVKNRSQSQPVV